MRAWIFDTECTGLHDEREIIEAAWIEIQSDDDALPIDFGAARTNAQLFQPETPSTCGALAVHHIIPNDLKNAAPSSSFYIPENVHYIVGHNIDFDWVAAGSPAHVKRIDTDCMSRWIWQDADSYSQSALIYKLYGATPITRSWLIGAHNAATDVENNARLLAKIFEAKPEIDTWAKLHAYSEECRIPRTCPFHQYRNVPLDELANMDPGYCQWMLRQDWLDPYLRTAVERVMSTPRSIW